MAGVMLKRLGHNVHILERNSTSLRTDHAAGMRTGPYANEFFDTYDQQPTPYGFDCPGFQFLDAHSKVKSLRNEHLKLTGWNVLYYRLRAMFDGFKSPLCPVPPRNSPTDGVATFDVAKEVTDIHEEGDKICAQVIDSAGNHKTIEADLILDAGGAYSKIKAKMMPDTEHPYAGYVAWRGTVPETEVSELTRSLFDTRFNVFAFPRGYILGYAVPGEKGELERGTRLINYVWYHNLPTTSPDFTRTMTDTSGHAHRNSVPIGKLSPDVWRDHLAYGSNTLDPAFFDLVENTKQPLHIHRARVPLAKHCPHVGKATADRRGRPPAPTTRGAERQPDGAAGPAAAGRFHGRDRHQRVGARGSRRRSRGGSEEQDDRIALHEGETELRVGSCKALWLRRVAQGDCVVPKGFWTPRISG